MWFYNWSETVHLINASLARDLASQLQLSQIVSAWIISRFLVKQWAGKRGKGRQSLKRCLWCRHSMTPDSDIMLWLVKSPNVDRFVVLLTVLDSFKITLLQFRKRFFQQTQISGKQYKFLCETSCLSLCSKKSRKYAFGLLQKEKKAFKYQTFPMSTLLL